MNYEIDKRINSFLDNKNIRTKIIMTKEEKIKEICKQSIGMLGSTLSETIANAISEGYKLGWEECAKQLGVKL